MGRADATEGDDLSTTQSTSPLASDVPGADSRAFLELMGAPTALFDAHGKVLEANARLLELAGRSRDEVVGSEAPHPWWSKRGWGAGEVVEGESDVAVIDRTGGEIAMRCVLAAIPWRPDSAARWVAILAPSSPPSSEGAGDEDVAHAVGAQASLVRVAREVARGARPDEVFDLVAREVASILDADAGLVLRYERDMSVVVGSFGAHRPRIGTSFPLRGAGAAVVAARTGRPARVRYRLLDEADPTASPVTGEGYASGVAAPIEVDGRRWGAVLAATTGERELRWDAETRLGHFAETVSLAIAGAHAREELATRSSVDALTGAANRGEFHARFAIEVVRALRHGRPLSLVVFDLDHFTRVNDTHGRLIGDRVLKAAAEAIRGQMRAEDILARVGGEEFALILPEADARTALGAAETACASLAGARTAGLPAVTLSGGVADLGDARDPSGLFAAADHAMCFAKRSGRNRVCRYLPEMLDVPTTGPAGPSDAEGVAGVRALALAVEARDPATNRHAGRVADLVERMAVSLGWSRARIAQLRQATLLHDVGKIGVPDTLLLKPGPLYPGEYERIKRHATLGANILAEVIGPEQTSWVRHHHERWDGRGYPDGLAGHHIPEGATLIAVADAFDVMVTGRPYAAARTPVEALEEIRSLTGAQFAPRAVEALEAALAAGPATS